MNNKKPINIFYEIFVVSLLILVAYRGEFILSGTGWGLFHLMLFLLPISSITARHILKNDEGKLFISTSLFGYVFGIYLWSAYATTEFLSINASITINNISSLVLGVLFAGLIFAFIATAVSFLFKKLIKKMWKLD